MSPKAPLLDIYIGRDKATWRLYFAATSWTPGLLQRCMNERQEICPVPAPDIADLDRFMAKVDSPFERHVTTGGGVEIFAKGRSAIALLVWLEAFVRRGRDRRDFYSS